MFTFPCISFRKISLLNDDEKEQPSNSNLQRYELSIDVTKLPLDFPLATSTKDKVVEDPLKPENFSQALNEGFAISAYELHYDKDSNLITVGFGNDTSLYGVLNNENYKIIKKYMIGCNYVSSDRSVVNLEALTGVYSCCW